MVFQSPVISPLPNLKLRLLEEHLVKNRVNPAGMFYFLYRNINLDIGRSGPIQE